MGCNSKISSLKVECCELKQTDTYKFRVGDNHIYKNGIKYAEVIETKKNWDESYTTLTVKTINHERTIYMLMDDNFNCK